VTNLTRLGRYQQGANLGPQLNRIIESAGIQPWEKPLQNLRSSRRTELQERFPDHVIKHWLRHSSAVAAKHYLQVTPEHWEAIEPTEATVTGGVRGGVTVLVTGHPRAATKTLNHKKTP